MQPGLRPPHGRRPHSTTQLSTPSRMGAIAIVGSALAAWISHRADRLYMERTTGQVVYERCAAAAAPVLLCGPRST